jgi:prefoldin beta subunit
LTIELGTQVALKTQLESQIQENEMVKKVAFSWVYWKEFDLLAKDSQIFKLIGPVLVQQDRQEAVTNVEKRLEYIRNEQ